MKQQSIPQGSPAVAHASAEHAKRSVVMGQGLVTPSVREHLTKTAQNKRVAAKPQSVVMGQGLVTPAVREHLNKVQRRHTGDKR
jgi:uncharacterized protein (DUF1786 family)